MTSEDINDLADKKGRQELLDSFIEKIAEIRVRAEEAHHLRETSSQHQAASIKGLWALAYIAHNDREEMLTVTKTLFEVTFAMFDDYSEKITTIEKEIQAIAEKSGTNLSKMQTDVEQLKETLGPKVNAVIQLLANLQKSEERRKTGEAGMVV